MPALHELQTAFVQTMFATEAPALVAAVAGDGLSPSARLQIYRHHVLTSLTEALQATFPVICRLVDVRFFRYAADTYIREHPPMAPCLSEYGADFPTFLREFPPCRDLAYLEDVARLEWALNTALHAEIRLPLDPTRLGEVAAEAIPRLCFACDPSLSYLRSRWAIDQIWRVHQQEEEVASDCALHEEDVCLEIRRWEDEVGFRRLDPAVYAFRAALAHGQPLATAAEAALEADAAFDCVSALSAWLTDGVVFDFTVAPDMEENNSCKPL